MRVRSPGEIGSPATSGGGSGRTITCAGIAAALTVLLCGVGSAQTLELTQNPLAGSRVFGTKGCSTCHAVDGLGGTIGPDLGDIRQSRSFYQLAAAMWNHLPEMRARMDEEGVRHPRLSPRQAGNLIAFLFTLDYFDPPGDVERGRRLFTRKRCVVCHQVGGFGGVMGPNLDHLSRYGSPIMVATAMWNHGPAMAEAMRERGIERPTFSGSELVDLVSYLESAGEPERGAAASLHVLPGRVERGRALFSEKRCVQCHNVRGEGGRLGPDLAAPRYHRSLTEFAAAMWNKVPAMTRAMRQRDIDVPELAPEEMADIVAYLYSVRYFAESGDPERGRSWLGDRGCLACHSLNGRGGDQAPDLGAVTKIETPAGVVAAMWNHLEIAEDAPPVEGDAWSSLSPEKMADIAAFLQGRGQ